MPHEKALPATMAPEPLVTEQLQARPYLKSAPTCEHRLMHGVERRVAFGGGHPPIGWRVGFLRAPFDKVLRVTLEWWRSLLPGVDEVELSAPFPDALLALAPLQTPWTREIIARTSTDEWTAHFTNNHLGGDSVSWCRHLSGVLGCDEVDASHIPVGQYPFPSTMFSMTAAGGSPRPHRSVAAGKYDSGRWEFLENGEPLPFEERGRYTSRLIRDRFDREMLLRYLGALGVRADDPDFWVGGVLLQHRVKFSPRTSTLEEVRRQYGIV
jgi:hypothetical protein